MTFPLEHPFAEAFTFMGARGPRIPAGAARPDLWWSEDAEHLSWRLGQLVLADCAAWVTIEAGLRLGIARWRGEPRSDEDGVRRVRQGAWLDRAKADDWLNRHRRGRDNGTYGLQTPYRFSAGWRARCKPSCAAVIG